MQTKEIDFSALYHQYYPMIFQVCKGYTGGTTALAEDLAQDVLIHMLNAMEKFRGESSVKTFVYRITVNTCLKHIRKEKKTIKVTALENAEIEEQLVQNRQVDQLYEAIGKLNRLQRLIIMMVLDDLKYSEIAEITGLSEANLRVKIHRIKKELKQKIEKINKYGK